MLALQLGRCRGVACEQVLSFQVGFLRAGGRELALNVASRGAGDNYALIDGRFSFGVAVGRGPEYRDIITSGGLLGLRNVQPGYVGADYSKDGPLKASQRTQRLLHCGRRTLTFKVEGYPDVIFNLANSPLRARGLTADVRGSDEFNCPREVVGPSVGPRQTDLAGFDAFGDINPADVAREHPIFRSCRDVCPEMVRVGKGSFMMGGVTPAGDPPLYDDKPRERIALPRSFALGRFDVTVAEYAAFVAATGRASGECESKLAGRSPQTGAHAAWRRPGFQQTARDPVVCVSLDDAQSYARWLSGRTGKRYRLPTEPEWEFAARAGGTGLYFWGEDNYNVCEHANLADGALSRVEPSLSASDRAVCDDGYAFTSPGGMFAPNPWGLYDMAGNVSQWVTPCYGCGDSSLRGGSWRGPPEALAVAARLRPRAAPYLSNDVGFRLLMELK